MIFKTLCGVVMLSAGCSGQCGRVLPLAGDALQGQFVYENHCAVCHGSDGSGISGPAMTERVPALTGCDIIGVVVDGGATMPAFGNTLDDLELAHLLEHLSLEYL